jgi:UPF0716 protein FxsA
MWKWLALMVIVPTVETWLLLQIGARIGPMPTLWLLLVAGAFGAHFAKREGTAVLRQLVADVQRGLPPAERLAEGALVLVGGVLLITPGVLTDLFGLLLIFPLTRRLLAPVALRWAVRRFSPHVKVTPDTPRYNPGRAPRPQPAEPAKNPSPNRHFDHPVR